jgi:hypothetical protein
VRVADDIWKAALANVQAEDRKLTDVIVEALKRYNAKAERKRRQEAASEEDLDT